MDELTVTVAILFAVFAVHTVFAVYLYRSLTDSASDQSGGESPHERTRVLGVSGSQKEGENIIASDSTASTDRTIQCPTCDVPNDPDFQFCRRCVADLSEGSAQHADAGSTNVGG